ncbi:lytic transglycosylase domain-containing protein [Leeia sp. TBRC 13508]|uniref:Lytic transglycosylase domain-containing protein n=1 Tax=Leeia speluncae TaxID=2884804 RepID=A0ABS8D7C6_9NEIS|nr:lytic transglycosylase domain-containing protein [Leeia speluncae]MCB6184087.1 lytic transglycosylase domain-containing protein [Leeia speluncae]
MQKLTKNVTLRQKLLMSSFVLLALFAKDCIAGRQEKEILAPAVQTAMQQAINDSREPKLIFPTKAEGDAWLTEMMRRLEKRVPDEFMRRRLLTMVQYEASRAGLDPQMVLGLIQVESGFKKYAISSVGAKGLMQVMPFWVKQIGNENHNLFDEATSLRFGCTILRHYLNIEKGDLYRALGRYNGSLGKPEYPNLVLGAWRKNWSWP